MGEVTSDEPHIQSELGNSPMEATPESNRAVPGRPPSRFGRMLRTRKRKVVFITVLVVIGFFLALAIADGGVFLGKEYLEPWKLSYPDRFEDPRVKLLARGILAANSHNMQPWRVVLDTSDNMVFWLYVDTSRLTPAIDPYSRQITISQGTLLEYVRIAGIQTGYDVDIDLFPLGEYDAIGSIESMNENPVAKVTISSAAEGSTLLFDEMFKPDTSRVSYKDTPLSQDQTDQLLALNTDPDVRLVLFTNSTDVDALGDIALKAARIEADYPAAIEESMKIFRPNEWAKNKHRDGFVFEGSGTSGLNLWFMQGLVTLFPFMLSAEATKNSFLSQAEMAVDSSPSWSMIITENNNRTTQVKAGMLYSRLVLTAHTLGIAMQPMSQALEEYSLMESVYDDIHLKYADDGQTIQMLMRQGEPTKDVPNTPRRDVTDIIFS